METKRKLVIHRERWLRGEGEYSASKLYRSSDGKQCCVGFYLEACGVLRERIVDIGSARTPGLTENLPEEAKWLASGEFGTGIGFSLYKANDFSLNVRYWDSYEDAELSLTSEEDRESLIIELFAKQGVEVTFE